MINKLNILSKPKSIPTGLLNLIYLSMFLIISNLSLYADLKPSNTLENKILLKNSISIIQNLSFGTFLTGNSGGTVIVPSQGPRRSTGSVILIPSHPGNPAIIVFTTNQTKIVTFTTGNIVNLTNGKGGSLTLQINDFYPASSFSPIVGQNNITIGGTLTVGSQLSTPAGNYSGSFNVTFNQQ